MTPSYPHNWSEIANAIKDASNWKCENCHHPHETIAGYCLTVHHIDGNTFNNDRYNLVALCQRCHLSWQRRTNPPQLPLFDLPPWLSQYLVALSSKSDGLFPQPNSLLPPYT